MSKKVPDQDMAAKASAMSSPEPSAFAVDNQKVLQAFDDATNGRENTRSKSTEHELSRSGNESPEAVERALSFDSASVAKEYDLLIRQKRGQKRRFAWPLRTRPKRGSRDFDR